MKYNKKFEPWIEKNEEKIFDKIDLGKSLDDAHEAIEKVKLWKVESEEMKAKLDKGNKAAKKMSNHENEDKIYERFARNRESLSFELTAREMTFLIPPIKHRVEMWRRS